ncbi:MAG: ABC transporter ATP-binding protein [Erysipelotrichaceae bacterium]|nr:ABC transporter ATP-binding protein [Erysipelotrichaceae bacterium]
MSIIKTNNLTKSYGTCRGIISLNLEVEEGEFFGFIGPNGAGKSTTIRTLLGLINPTSGEATVLGKDIIKDKIEILDDIGYLPSEAIFYQGMKVKDILKFSSSLRKKDCSKEQEELCKRLNLDINKKVEELSFGNRKKVGIVCALQHKPKLLILDEPTSGLDPLMQKEFFAILHERNKEGTTIFLSSHVLSEIEQNCTRAALIKEGKISACDKVENLIKTSTRRVTIRGKVDLNKLEGIRDLSSQNNSTSFLYSGNINELINLLSSYNIEDLLISEPSLEEVFLHYYEEE